MMTDFITAAQRLEGFPPRSMVAQIMWPSLTAITIAVIFLNLTIPFLGVN